MTKALPSGVVTFVLTDIVGSTRLWQEAPEAMDRAIARHVEIIATAVAARGGMVVKSRGEGDSTFSVFGRASEAVAAAHDAQVAMRAEPWSPNANLTVRFALHTGETVERDGDYFGPVVNRAARLRSTARGGEVLVSGATAPLVMDALPDGVRLIEIGEVTLRDHDRIEHVYVLDAAGLAVPERGEARGMPGAPPDVDLRLLGPVHVLVDHEVVDIGGPKERTVLALLALSDGPVTHERLIDELWEDEAPASARKTLQTYVWRLRRVLTDEVLASVTSGYELRLSTEPDAARFERLARDGIAMVDGDDAADVAAVLSDALDLWRGDPLAGCVPTGAVDAHRARLNELRATATERRIDAELRLGRHAEWIGDLERLVQDDPFREERWRLLVLALYRSGRQRDALRAYQRARTTLIEGSGVEPGPALHALERAILEQRADLSEAAPPEMHRAAATVDAWPVARPPIPPAPLIGRRAELSEVRALLDHQRLVTVTGPGGAGKTRLALAVANECRTPVAFCDLSILARGGPVLHAVARAAGIEIGRVGAPATRDMAATIVAHLRDRGLLVIVDNCEHVLQQCADIASRLLTTCPDVRLLATSREPLGVPGEHVISLGPLDVPVDDADVAAESVLLFEQRATAAHPGFTFNDTNRLHVLEICRRLEGLPLSIELAAARLSHLTPEDLARRLDRPLQVLATRQRSGPERHRTLQATLDWSHDLLGNAEQNLLRRLAVFAGRFDLDDVEGCCMADLDDGAALDLMRNLVDCSLVVADLGDRSTSYRMLETVRAYARDRLARSVDEDATRAAHCEWFLARIERIPWGDRVLALDTRALLITLQEDLRRALVWAEAAGRHDLVARLVASMIGVWKEGHLDEADRWFPVAIEHEATLPASERYATALSSLMCVFYWDGDRNRLQHHRLRLAALAESLPPNEPITSLAYSTLASLSSRSSGDERAWDRYADLAMRHAPATSPPLVAMSRCQKARALMFRGDAQQAIAVLEEAAAALGPDADRFEFSPQEDLALAYHLVGHHERTLAIAEARLSQSAQFLPWWVAIYASLAAAALGDHDAARTHLAVAAERASTLSIPLFINDCRVAVGAIALLEGRLDTAVDLLAGMPTGSTTYNPLGVLLRHYQELAHAAVGADRWERAQTTTVADAQSLVEAELRLNRPER